MSWAGRVGNIFQKGRPKASFVPFLPSNVFTFVYPLARRPGSPGQPLVEDHGTRFAFGERGPGTECPGPMRLTAPNWQNAAAYLRGLPADIFLSPLSAISIERVEST